MSARGYGVGYSLPNEEDYALAKLGPALDEAEALGVDYVELPLYALDLVANGRVLTERLKRVKALTSGRALGYTMHGPLGLNLMEEGERAPIHRAVFKAQLEIAAELGGVNFVTHVGRYGAGDPPQQDAARARLREALLEVADFAGGRGITIVVENLYSARAERETPSLSELAAEIEALDHPAIRACLDFSHAFLDCGSTGADFLEQAEALAPFAAHLHIHDSFGRPSSVWTTHRAERLAYGIGDLHLPFGMGSIPWDDLAQRCRFPKGAIVIYELPPPYWSDLAASLEAVRAFAAHLHIGGAE